MVCLCRDGVGELFGNCLVGVPGCLPVGRDSPEESIFPGLWVEGKLQVE